MHIEFECCFAVSFFKRISFYLSHSFQDPSNGFFFWVFSLITCTSLIFTQTLLGQVVIYPVVSQEFIAFGALETSVIQTSGFHHLGARFKINSFVALNVLFIVICIFFYHVSSVLCLFHHFAALVLLRCHRS